MSHEYLSDRARRVLSAIGDHHDAPFLLEALGANLGTDYLNGGDLQDLADEIRRFSAEWDSGERATAEPMDGRAEP